MKNSLIYSLLIVTTVLFTSCKDKISLVGKGVESAVVIGVLDQADTIHYIKITRTFIGDGQTSAVDIAKISDSSYFNKVEVTIKEILSNGSVGRTFVLDERIVHNKNTNGAFYAPDQKVYAFDTPANQPLLEDARYQMTAKIDDGRIVITGETKLVSGITIANVGSTNYSIKLTKSGSALGMYENQSINVSNVGSAYKINAKVRFDYREFTTGLLDSTDHSISFDLGQYDVQPGLNSSQIFTFSGETFFKTLKSKIPVSSSIEKRINTGFEFSFTGASSEFSNYIEVNKPSSSLAQTKPTYTNLKITEGHNVIGIFASRQTIRIYKPATALSSVVQTLDKKSRRELCVGPLTGNLSFCSRHSADFSPVIESWHCND
ncbi:MAG: hypothetical protein M9916_13390 [Crocinitomicaceae bacterium]|nr:hypothetical protein [Crocinitomicaceae bacterium]